MLDILGNLNLWFLTHTHPPPPAPSIFPPFKSSASLLLL